MTASPLPQNLSDDEIAKIMHLVDQHGSHRWTTGALDQSRNKIEGEAVDKMAVEVREQIRALLASRAASPLTDDEDAAEISNAEIDAIADSMPDGLKGFARGWGWRQFARKVLEGQRLVWDRDGARYRWLRKGPNFGDDYVTTGTPWVVHIEREHGAPTMCACYGPKLDAAIDAALAQSEDGQGGAG